MWFGLILLPIVFNVNNLYELIFSSEWYDEKPKDYWLNDDGNWPSPVGLILGIMAVIVGQIFVLNYFYFFRKGMLGKITPIQKVGPPAYEFTEGLVTHLSQPEGFVMLGGYLIGTWIFGLMPPSYYCFSGGINIGHVIIQLLIQDFVQYVMHYLEHKLDARIYRASHKPHHKFTNPRLFDAFNGSLTDTFCMILIPLIITARCVNANVWSYMAFGSIYANWLTLIHAEYSHPWDAMFRRIGFGTAADHHVHHKLFVFNYGHLFMYWDIIFKTYKNPENVSVFTETLAI